MLVNFCDTCLRTDVICSTVCTEGYEASNLVNNSDKGFLAYSCIKPPVTIDFIFISNIQISHVIVWPQVGAQKSCGFQLSVKSSDTSNEPFTVISTAFLQKGETGISFHQREISCNVDMSAPINFVKHSIKSMNITNYASILRLNILKTENSVPALGKVEIWGRVSPKCGKDIAMNVMALWMNRFNDLTVSKTATTSIENNQRQKKEREQVSSSLNVPEEFLDPITFEIMTQPIILPSGKIIDQKTLEKYGYNEATWGRPVSDPFTGIHFNNVHKPIAALPLKARIDKFLLENSNDAEIKKLPRVLGANISQLNNVKNVNVISCVPKSRTDNVCTVNNNGKQLKRTFPKEETSSYYNSKKSFHGHSLPVVSIKNSNPSNNLTEKPLVNMTAFKNKILTKEEISKKNAIIEHKLNTNIQVASMPTCKCCTEKIFYKLPCEHIICRKALLSLKKNQCTNCKLEFKTCDPQRFHLCN
ncbi:PREDICTED: RING finger protein 37 [Ceratosolen solmsi marchali]|uniref:RING finger protein 37 n=1 Tax=Ceratosolen solmsi marchali TaxID=326594 RepID=A0AAJ6YJG9_9HYME|nr:PREDICTED: RING finger protein 37 [Ceratosolen solmsi marchali]